MVRLHVADQFMRAHALGFRRYRPTAPITTEDATVRLIGRACTSPFMSFAPIFTPDAARALPAAVHLDSTARIQTVTQQGQPWLFELLLAVERLFGWPVLLNTSMNVRGKPIVNSLLASFQVFDESVDVYALVLEDHVFHRQERQKV